MASNDHFVALSECHFLNPQTMAEIRYYRNTSRWWASVDGVMRAWAGRDLTSEDASWPHPIASELIKYMDEAGVDVCFALKGITFNRHSAIQLVRDEAAGRIDQRIVPSGESTVRINIGFGDNTTNVFSDGQKLNTTVTV